MTFEQMRAGAVGAVVDVDSVEIRQEDLLMRMRELDIHDISTFLDSREFAAHGFQHDKGRRVIIRNV